MACQNCDSKTPPSGAALLYETEEVAVLGRDGRMHDIQQSLLPKIIRPQRGWYVVLLVKGQTIRVEGSSAKQVFLKCRDQLDRNGVQISDLNLWLNLNIQWLERSPRSNKLTVSLDRLLALTHPGEVQIAPTRKREPVSPDVWGSKGWAMLQMYLAQDVYAYSKFLSLATELLSWVDPMKNPTLGCAACYRDFSISLKELRDAPTYSQEGAREWLVSTMNGIRVKKGLAPLSSEEASKLNYWE